MNDVPPSQQPRDDIDSFYRRASALDLSRPSDRTRQAVLAHARKVAGSHEHPSPVRRRQRWWRPAVFGALVAAGFAGLLVLPQIPKPHFAPEKSYAVAEYSQPGARARTDGRAPAGAASLAAGPSPAAKSSSTAVSPLAPPPPAPAADSAGVTEASKAQVGSPETLRLAAETGDLKRLQRSLDQLTDVNSRDDAGRTALLLAILHGQTQAVKILLAQGANPNIADVDGVSPLSAATAANQSAMIRMLKDAGAH
jgi:ankyrin repeat protein